MKRLAPLGVTRLALLGVSRFVPLAMSIILVAAIAAATLVAGPLMYINETDSMPRGLYVRSRERKRAGGFAGASAGTRGASEDRSEARAARPPRNANVGDVVLFSAPVHIMELARERGYLAPGNLFMKTVAATGGMEYCVEWPEPDRGVVTIEGKVVGPAFSHDSMGRALPRIDGCHVVPEGCFLPLSTHHERSFDGRYYGVVPSQKETLPTLERFEL